MHCGSRQMSAASNSGITGWNEEEAKEAAAVQTQVDGWGVAGQLDLRAQTAAEISQIRSLLEGADDAQHAVLLYLIDAQRDLCARLGDSSNSGGGGGGAGGRSRRADVARQLSEGLQLLVVAADTVPSGAYEMLVAVRETLQAQAGLVQHDRVTAPLAPRPAAQPATPPAIPAAAMFAAFPAMFAALRFQPAASTLAGGTAATSVAAPDAPDAPEQETKDQAERAEAEVEAQLLSFVVDKVSAGTAQFKVNKLHQVLAALVKEHLVAAAVTTTKRALDPGLLGHIKVSAFKAWWPNCKYASGACVNTWMRDLNLTAMRAKQAATMCTRACN